MFSRSGNCQGILKKCQGIFGYLTNVREMSGNFVMTINFFFLKMVSFLLLPYFFQAQKFLLAFLHSVYFPIIPFSKCFIASMSTIFYINCFLAKTVNKIGIFNHFCG